MYIPNSLIVDDVNPGFRICSELELVAFRVFAEQGDGSVEAIEAHRGVDPACIGADRGGVSRPVRNVCWQMGSARRRSASGRSATGNLGLVEVRELS